MDPHCSDPETPEVTAIRLREEKKARIRNASRLLNTELERQAALRAARDVLLFEGAYDEHKYERLFN